MAWRNAFRGIRDAFRHRDEQRSPGRSRGDGVQIRDRNYEDWHRTQFDGISDRAPIRQLVIGLDFGTSYTKVAIGEVRISYAVPFPVADGQSAYLLPTILRWEKGDSDSVHLETAAERFGHRIDRLKIRLLDGDTSTEALAHNAAYLALVLRYVRGWLMNEHARTYERNRLDWLVNIGLPTDTFFANELAPIYRHIVCAAWALSVQEGPITMAQAYSQFTDGPPTDPDPSADAIHPGKVTPFPELAAEVAAYLRSPMRREDLHLLIDVGAGTLDVAVFNVYETRDEDPLLPVFAKSVTQLGTAYLMQARTRRLPGSVELGWSYQDPLPDPGEVARKAGIPEATIKEADEEFQREVRMAVLAPVRETWDRKYPTSRRWEEGVPLIACGGGMASSFFEDIVGDLIARGKPFPFQRLRYPRPERLESPDASPAELDRLNVAYGLSFDPLDIAQTWGPDDIDDDPRDPTPRPYGGPFIDKDKV